ncbi:agaA33 [Symbiodinium natans]|uniref:AgaA33 protein n=1 Tax=Symbiodinium natans TaxID=878477 RepID=A0A812UQ06_9DINO|nr:agaA33 [Symbiodinium natans]
MKRPTSLNQAWAVLMGRRACWTTSAASIVHDHHLVLQTCGVQNAMAYDTTTHPGWCGCSTPVWTRRRWRARFLGSESTAGSTYRLCLCHSADDCASRASFAVDVGSKDISSGRTRVSGQNCFICRLVLTPAIRDSLTTRAKRTSGNGHACVGELESLADNSTCELVSQ